ncbi:hypothetical protein B0T20DRAFT_208218 [Sordaria brevicollis]|uniref:Uncharacterized protein n=1 Tax=Sordaria brevicollis TaxID=83679 RepID=A0AAE0PED7_SORBR|nr:hypothetical protein B0T20DRAFT_208218 [Sordaria brevicollis]
MHLTQILPWSLLLLVHSALSAPSRTCRDRNIKHHQDRCADNALLQLLDPADQPSSNRKLAESFCSSYFAGPAMARPVQSAQPTTVTPPPAVSPMPIAASPHEDNDDNKGDNQPDLPTITITITTTRTITTFAAPTTTITTTQAPAAITARALPHPHPRLNSQRRRRVVARAPPMMEHCPQPWRGQPEDQIRRACECLVGPSRERGTPTVVVRRRARAAGAEAEESTGVMTAPAPMADV